MCPNAWHYQYVAPAHARTRHAHDLKQHCAHARTISRHHGTPQVRFKSTPFQPQRPQMTQCCTPRCFGRRETVRWCPSCSASFAVCAMHRDHVLRCPWPGSFMIPCSALVPPDQSWSAQWLCEPMYLRPQDFSAWSPEKKKPTAHCIATPAQGHLNESAPSPGSFESVAADQVDIDDVT